jgi:hypothetical protein
MKQVFISGNDEIEILVRDEHVDYDLRVLVRGATVQIMAPKLGDTLEEVDLASEFRKYFYVKKND